MGKLLTRGFQTEDEARAEAAVLGRLITRERILLSSRPRWREQHDGSFRLERNAAPIIRLGCIFAAAGFGAMLAGAALGSPWAAGLSISSVLSGLGLGAMMLVGVLFAVGGGIAALSASSWVREVTTLHVVPGKQIEVGSPRSWARAEVVMLERVRVDVRYTDSRREANREQVRVLVKVAGGVGGGYLRILLWDAESETGLPAWVEPLIRETEERLAVKARILRSLEVEWRSEPSE